MSLVLHSVADPRDRLEKATRMELFRFAQARGVTEIREVPGQGIPPATLMRKILRSKGLTDIAAPDRPLGVAPQIPSAPVTADNVSEISADDDLARQWQQAQQEKPRPVASGIDVGKMGIQELRQECKRRGIKLARTDNMISMRAKLGG